MGNKGGWCEFGETAGLGLDASEEFEVKDYVLRGFSMAWPSKVRSGWMAPWRLISVTRGVWMTGLTTAWMGRV
jgi:hypothetical protein